MRRRSFLQGIVGGALGLLTRFSPAEAEPPPHVDAPDELASRCRVLRFSSVQDGFEYKHNWNIISAQWKGLPGTPICTPILQPGKILFQIQPNATANGHLYVYTNDVPVAFRPDWHHMENWRSE